MLCKDGGGGGDGGATGGMWKTVGSVKMVSVYLSLKNYTVTVSNKCYDNFGYISIMNCSQQHKQQERNSKWNWMLLL
jgi:hypothetical protein